MLLPFRAIVMMGLLMLCGACPANAEPVGTPEAGHIVNSTMTEVSLVPLARIVKDPGGVMSADTVLSRQENAGETTAKRIASFGFSNTVYWFSIQLRNPDPAPVQRLLVFEPAWLDHVQVILIKPDGTRQVYEGGDTLTFAHRTILHRQINFDLTLQPGQSQLLVRTQTRDPFIVGMTLWERSAYYASDSRGTGYFGFVYGALASLLLFNLVLFISVREKVYAAYVAYLLAFLVMHATYNGFTYEYLWPGSPVWGNWAHSTFIYLFMLTGLYFTNQFLELRTRLPHAYRWTMRFGLALVVSSVGTAILGGYGLHVSSSILWVIVYSPFLLFMGILSLSAGNRAARYFIPATAAGFLGSFITALTVSGFLPFSYYTFRAVDFGMLVDAVLLSLALADRLRLTRLEVEQAKFNLIETTRAHERETQLRQELAQSLNFQRTLFDSNAAALFTVDSHRIITQLNPALCEMFGYAHSELIGQSAAILHESHDAFIQFGAQFKKAIEGRTFARIEYRYRRKDGSLLWAEILGSPIDLANGERGVLWSAIDHTTLHEAREQISHQATHDDLTGLPNRRALEQHLPKAIARARRIGNMVAVGMFDLDDFKPVNDTWGHEAGDRLLQELARRLQGQLRESDMLARLGGDEFVLVIEDLDELQVIKQVTQAARRFHQAVESAFDVAPDKQAFVGMSMGLALFPLDSEESDILLRQADAAMYQSKLHKLDRTRWWRFCSLTPSPPEREEPFDPYGTKAATLLERSKEHFQIISTEFVETFYAELSHVPEAKSILANLGDDEMCMLMSRQAEHIGFLLDPATTQAMILKRAQHVGQAHALSGVGSSLLVQAMMLYRRLLSEHLNQAVLSARDRYRILLTAESRLHDDIQSQIQTDASITQVYLRILSEMMPRQGTLWADATRAEITALGNLPGIQGALLLRLNTEGAFSVEAVAGPRGQEIAAVLQTPGSEAVADPDSPRGQGLTAQAWRTLRILSSPSYSRDPRYQYWHSVAHPLGVRSSLSVPVVNAIGQSEAVVSLFGAYPNQFESMVMQQFARGLEQRWEGVWLRCSSPPPVLSEELALLYRQRLFGDGLIMHMQPLVDLQTGQLVKVEALARLQLPDGETIPPVKFLPLLGRADLGRLFRMGLDVVLSQLVAWEKQGLSIQGSLNLPPSTLLEPDCARWVEDALRLHGVAPNRLTLELLETEGMDHQTQDRVIDQLVRVGVHLAMDDLGSGYSSLQRLSALPFETIKADQSLLARIQDNPVQVLSLIGAIIQMGRDFERSVVVEGLENEGLIEAAAILGAPYGQGYGLARPMPATDILPWSKTFKLPIQAGEIHTYLGALAYHWKIIHGGEPASPTSADTCPLATFLNQLGEVALDAAAWHIQFHSGQDAPGASKKLTDWLVGKIREQIPGSL